MNRLTWSRLDETARRAALTRPVQTVAQQTRDAVAALIAQVRAQGDDALRAITARFDGVELSSFEVSEAEFAAAEPPCRRTSPGHGGRRRAHRPLPRRRHGQGIRGGDRAGGVCERMLRPIGRGSTCRPAARAAVYRADAGCPGTAGRLPAGGAVRRREPIARTRPYWWRRG